MLPYIHSTFSRDSAFHVKNPRDEAIRMRPDTGGLMLSPERGSGKSAISHELAATLHAKRRPYGCFFSMHDDAAEVMYIVRLLAYVCSSVDTSTCPTMEERFMALVVIPLQEFATICPEMTLIDGVEECPADIRPAFLAALRAGVLHLLASVKVILAGRPRDGMRGIVEALVHLPVAPERRRHRAIPAARAAPGLRSRRTVPAGEASDCPR
ncbi:hypothetical protein EDB89DRAFT_1155453 [Lactarius sanguifluus]|nr:hypothetical protein EDB89DRAFT_1155453 [Lactarius sanguifluus]